MFFGSVIVIFAVMALLNNLGIINIGWSEIFWPVLFIAVGLSFMRNDILARRWHNGDKKFHE